MRRPRTRAEAEAQWTEEEAYGREQEWLVSESAKTEYEVQMRGYHPSRLEQLIEACRRRWRKAKKENNKIKMGFWEKIGRFLKRLFEIHL